MKILAINPGSTSTRVAYFHEEELVAQETIDHSMAAIDSYETIIDQLDMRVKLVLNLLKEWNISMEDISACVGRGGLLPGVKAGGYIVNEAIRQTFLNGIASPHAANLGALIAYEIANPLRIPAYVYDCVTADEFEPIAKITGMPDCIRHSMCHVLNQKAVARKVAKKYGKDYQFFRTIVAHLGGGISIGAHKNGKIIDCIRDDAGPFSPERSGSIPLLDVIRMCYTGKYNYNEMIKKVRGMGGMKAYLGTTDLREIEKRMEDGDELAKKIFDAQVYQIAKGIGEMSPVLDCQMDCIILTGGMAYSEKMTGAIESKIERLAAVEIYPGEEEMEALNLGALRLLRGEEEEQEYRLPEGEEMFV